MCDLLSYSSYLLIMLHNIALWYWTGSVSYRKIVHIHGFPKRLAQRNRKYRGVKPLARPQQRRYRVARRSLANFDHLWGAFDLLSKWRINPLNGPGSGSGCWWQTQPIPGVFSWANGGPPWAEGSTSSPVVIWSLGRWRKHWCAAVSREPMSVQH